MVYDSSHYVALLRAKQGELDALAHTEPSVRAGMTPLLDLMADDPEDFEQDVVRLLSRLEDGWGTADRAILDLNSLGDVTTDDGQHVVDYTHERARDAGLIAVPTAWGSSSDAYLAAVQRVAAVDRHGACLRLTIADMEAPSEIGTLINETVDALTLTPSDIDLIMDVGFVDGNNISVLAAILAVVLPLVPDQAEWRSYSVASGAFPFNLNAFRPYIPGRAVRYDAELWTRVTARSLPRTPGYGDYGVTNPQVSAAGPWRGAPNLRYTLNGEWLVMKGPARSPQGNYEFHSICAQLAAPTPSHLMPADYSWGDAEIQRCARRQGGPGAGTQWRAWATSHHLARVVDRLATTGAP